MPGYGARLGIPVDAFVVLFLGRMHRIKRLDILADAFAIARTTHRSLHLVLAGPDEDMLLPEPGRGLPTTCRTCTARPGRRRRQMVAAQGRARDRAVLRFRKLRRDHRRIARRRCTVIATRTCPWPELETQACGRWVEQTPAAIADAIRDLADDPAARQAMGQRGSAFARERYSWDSIARTMTGIYSGVH